MTSVWLREQRPRRGQPLTRERIVDAAVTLLDGDGGQALTCRRLTERPGVTPTALYCHADTRDGRGDLRALVHGWRAAMLRQPWAPALIGRPVLGPNVRERTAYLESALGRGGQDVPVVTRLIANFAIGAALTDATWRRSTGG